MVRPLVEIRDLVSNLEDAGGALQLVEGSIRYRSPIGVFSPARKVELSNRREELVQFLHAREAASFLRSGQLSRQPPQLSCSQHLWWMAYGGRLEGYPFPLNISLTIELEYGDPGYVCETVRAVLADHAVLRSRLFSVDGKLQIDLLQAASFPIVCEDLSELGYPASLNAAKVVLGQFISQLIPIEGGWLIRGKLCLLGRERALLALSINHIVFDGASRQILKSELKNRLRNPQMSGLCASGPSFFDYSAHEREILNSSSGKALEQYWRNLMSGVPLVLSPIGKRPLRWLPGPRRRHRFLLPTISSHKIAALGRHYGTTSFVVYLSVLVLTIGRWSKSEDFSIRALGDKRVRPDLSRLIGLMYCADTFKAHVPSGDDLGALIERMHLEHNHSLKMRLPTIQFFPPFVAHAREGGDRENNDVPAAINYVSGEISEGLMSTEQSVHVWPPIVEMPNVQIWSRRISPIFLQLQERRDGVSAELQFNEDIISSTEQSDFISKLFIVFKEHGLSPAQ